MRYLIYSLFVFLIASPLYAQLDQGQELLTYANEIANTYGRIEIKDDGEAILEVRNRYTILNAQSKANLCYVHYDDDDKLLKIDAEILNMAGDPIRKVKKSEIRDVTAGEGMYDDARIRYIELEYPTYPYLVEFTYTKRIKGINYAAFPDWYFQRSGSTAVTKSTFELLVPEGLHIDYRTYNTTIEPTILSSDEGTEYRWTLSNQAALAHEPYSPPYFRRIPFLRLSVKQFVIDEYRGSMQSWEEYGAFLHELWAGRDAVPPALAEEIRNLTAQATSTIEKVAILYRYMQQNMRYVSIQWGIGGWQPFDANYVYENGFGDCKALSNYMKAMLQEVGIESYPVIVAAGSQTPLQVTADYVDPAFNHAILYVPETDTWLECTSNSAPAGYLGSFTQNRTVLLVTPEGGRLARTPSWSTTENVQQEEAVFQLAADGSASMQYQAHLSGIPQENWRFADKYETPEAIENRIRKIGRLPNLSIADVALKASPDSAYCQLQFQATIPRYANKAGQRIFVPLNKLSVLEDVPAPVEKRTQPVFIDYGYTQELTIHYHLPPGYRVESIPDNQEMESEFAHYQLNISATDKAISVRRSLLMQETELPASAYTAFREFALQLAKTDAAMLVLVQE